MWKEATVPLGYTDTGTCVVGLSRITKKLGNKRREGRDSNSGYSGSETVIPTVERLH
jgi:hypothetical protein